MRYFFQHDYPGKNRTIRFNLDLDEIGKIKTATTIFAAAKTKDVGATTSYYTTGNGRVIGFMTSGKTVEKAMYRMGKIAAHVGLSSRSDIGLESACPDAWAALKKLMRN